MVVVMKRLDFVSKIPRLPKDDNNSRDSISSKPSTRRYSHIFDSHSWISSEHNNSNCSTNSESSMERYLNDKCYKTTSKRSYMKTSHEKQKEKTTIELLKARVFQLEEEISTQRAEVFMCKNQCKAVEDSMQESNNIQNNNYGHNNNSNHHGIEMTYMEQVIQMQSKLIEALERKTELLSTMTLVASFLSLAVIVMHNR